METIKEAIAKIKTIRNNITAYEEYYTKLPGNYSCGCGEYIPKSDMVIHNKTCEG